MKRSPLIILFITLFIDMLGFGLILPLIPVYITHYGGSSWIGGLLMTAFSLMQFVFTPIWGRASDKYGRRPLILLSLIGSALSYFSFGMANSLAVLFIARIASGILTSASLPAAQAYIADVTTPEKRAGGMAVLGAAFGLGFAFGPAIGGVLNQYTLFGLPSLATPSLFAAGLALINFILAFFLLPESHHDRASAQAKNNSLRRIFPDIMDALKNPVIGPPITVFSFLTFSFAAVESCFSWMVILRFHNAIVEMAQKSFALKNPSLLWQNALPALQQDFIEKARAHASTTIFIIVGIMILITQAAVMGGLARRVGDLTLVRIGVALLTLSLIGIAFAPSLFILQLLSAGIAIGNGLSSPALSALIMQSATADNRGLISGAQQGVGSLARILAPPVNNYLVGVNTAIPFLTSSVLMGVSFLYSLRLSNSPATNEDDPPSGLAH